MAKRKLVALASLTMVAVLLVATGARAEAVATTIRASGLIADGTGSTLGLAMAFLTVADGPDEDTLPDPVTEKPVFFKVGDTVVCDPLQLDADGDPVHPESTTDSVGVARCGLLLALADFAAAGAKYTVEFPGDEAYAASSDTGSLYWHASTGDVLP